VTNAAWAADGANCTVTLSEETFLALVAGTITGMQAAAEALTLTLPLPLTLPLTLTPTLTLTLT